MTEKAEIISLLKNLQVSLKKYTIKELNKAMNKVLDEEGFYEKVKEDQVALVFQVVCNQYNISRQQLIYSKAKGEVRQAKMITYCLLHFQLELPIRYIAKRLFYLKWHNNVGIAIKYHNNLNPQVKPDKEFIAKLDAVKQQVATQLTTIKTEKI
jgi:chromosomal replication initiation ATPase DnaA